MLGAALAALLGGTGCATVNTLQALDDGSPVLFSGSRLNAEALIDRNRAERRAGTEAPRNAALDLPFSAALDLWLLPITGPVAMMNGLNGLLRRLDRP